MSGVETMSEVDSATTPDLAQRAAARIREPGARRKIYNSITQHLTPRNVELVLGGDGFTSSPRERFTCVAVVRSTMWAAVCARTEYGDAAISRARTGDVYNSPDDMFGLYHKQGPWLGCDQIWLSRDAWGPKSEDWDAAARFANRGIHDDWDTMIPRKPIHMVGVDVIEQSFGLPIERIADAAREGRLGRIQSREYGDRSAEFEQRKDLSNLEAFALAMCVYAQAGGE